MSKAAIDATRLNAFSIEPERLTIITSKKHFLYDERVKLPIDESLVRNIMVHGVKLPVLVAKDGDHIVVVDGRQRVRAALEANVRLQAAGKEPIKVKIFVERGDAADLFGVCIIGNEFRKDDAPLIKARKAKRLLDMNADVERCAQVFGISKIQLERWLKLLELAEPVVEAVEAGEITASAAIELADLSREDQVVALEKLKTEAPKAKDGSAKPISVKQTKKAAKKTVAKKTVTKKGEDEEIEITAEPEFDRPSLRDLKRVYADQRLPDEDKQLLGWVLGYVSAKEAEVAEYLKDEEAAAAAKH